MAKRQQEFAMTDEVYVLLKVGSRKFLGKWYEIENLRKEQVFDTSGGVSRFRLYVPRPGQIQSFKVAFSHRVGLNTVRGSYHLFIAAGTWFEIYAAVKFLDSSKIVRAIEERHFFAPIRRI